MVGGRLVAGEAEFFKDMAQEAREWSRSHAEQVRRFREKEEREAAERRRRVAEDALWGTVESDSEFAALFLASPVVEAVAGQPDSTPALLVTPDICWRFASGLWLAMTVEIEGDYSCGYETGKIYRTYRP